MRLSTIFTVGGVLTAAWLFGLNDFLPKLKADVAGWEGSDVIDRIGSNTLRFVSNQWKAKVDRLDQETLPPSVSKTLGSDICMANTTNPDAVLSKKEYDRHVEAIRLLTKSPLQSPNNSVFCFDKRDHTGFIYKPEWVPNKFLKINAATGSETVIDLTPKKDANGHS
jgi:hypothetical protein